MFLASPVKRGRLFTLTAHVQVLAKNMAAKTHVGFFAEISLCMLITLCWRSENQKSSQKLCCTYTCAMDQSPINQNFDLTSLDKIPS